MERSSVRVWPISADSQEMVDRVRGVARPLQLLLQGGQGVLPEALVNQTVLLKALVADGQHVGLLVHEVLHGVAAEIFDALLTGPLAVLFLFPEGKKLVDDLEKALVLLVDHLHADVVFVLPNKLGVHIHSSSAAGPAPPAVSLIGAPLHGAQRVKLTKD